MAESSPEVLTAACLAQGLAPALVPPVVHYLGALQRWNRVHNLTTVVAPEAMVTRHILDSLSLRPWQVGATVLDVGSGAGLPGLVLALADQHCAPEVPPDAPPNAPPDMPRSQLPSLPGLPGATAIASGDYCASRRYLLLDSRLKRVRFLRQMVAELALTQVDVVHSRVEDLHPEPSFATVLSRAFAAPGEFVARAGHCLAPGGRMLAMLGVAGPDPISLPPGWVCRRLVPVVIPGLAAHRHIAVIERERERETV